jgi:hypothetical protein
MREFSAEDIQRAADVVSRGGFGDFMFSDPDQNRATTRRRTSRHRMTSSRNTSRQNTSRRNTSRRMTSRRCCTSRKNTSIQNTSRCCNNSGWRNTSRGNNQMKSYWKDGNMWKLKIRRGR